MTLSCLRINREKRETVSWLSPGRPEHPQTEQRWRLERPKLRKNKIGILEIRITRAAEKRSKTAVPNVR